MPTRRAHSKSRRGCTPCKTRHLKCNEARPVCSRCRDVDRECSYPTRTLARHQGADQQVSLSTGGLASSDSYGLALSITTSTGGTSAEVGDQGDIYTIRHIRLLDNFDSVVLSGADPAGQQQRKAYMEIALEFPFLLNQMLALSAAHMSVSNTTSGAADATEATFLQTRALEQFNRFQSTPRETTSEQQRIAVFLYSSLLSMHVLFDALASSESGEPDRFLDCFTTCLSIQRGVAAVVNEPGSWDIVKAYAPMVLGSSSLADFAAHDDGHECDVLYSLVEASHLSQSRRGTLVQVTESLQWAFDIQRRVHMHGSEHGVTAVLAWACRLPNDFMSMLQQRVPETLVILTYYAVLLHRAAKHWAIGDAGQYIIKSLSTWLGSYWAEWLSWPLENIT